jgi:hypothetical protein
MQEQAHALSEAVSVFKLNQMPALGVQALISKVAQPTPAVPALNAPALSEA